MFTFSTKPAFTILTNMSITIVFVNVNLVIYIYKSDTIKKNNWVHHTANTIKRASTTIAKQQI